MNYCYLKTPGGELMLAGNEEGLHHIVFPEGKGHMKPKADWQHLPDAFPEARQQLLEYFAGERRDFDLPLAPEGSDFQREVWSALRNIPYGTTISYGELARRVGRPAAARAVGAANGRNPIPIVIPCHRVIGKDGSLTGFGGGLQLKERLLELESPLLGLATD